MFIVFPRRRNEPGDCLRNTVTLAQSDFERIVETCRVTRARFQQQAILRQAKLLTNFTFACADPAAVATDRVDLPIVCHKSKGLSQRPAGLRVGRVALMKDGEGALKISTCQIDIENGQLLR